MLKSVVCLVVVIGQVACQFSAIGSAASTARPCGQTIGVTRYLSGPTEDYYDVTVPLDAYPNLNEFRLRLILSAPANVRAKKEDARVSFFDRGFSINYYNEPRPNFLRFTVTSKRGRSFPNIQSLTLNGFELCPNPEKIYENDEGEEADSDDQTLDNKFSILCGRKLVHHKPLITNGLPSQEGDWPWHVAIYHRQSSRTIDYKCGGTLIADDTILTAAHCVTDGGRLIVPNRIIVRLGQHNRLISGVNTQEFQVFEVKSHSEFDLENLRNDIAILKLQTRAQLNNYVQPICIWDNDRASLDEIVGLNGIVVGWGLNEEDQLTDILTQAVMPVVSITECLESNSDVFGSLISSTNYCAGFRNGTSVCNGDSGGGMYFEKNNRYFIRGIVSVSVSQGNKDVCNPKHFVLFTDAGKYKKWILNHL